MWLPRGDSNRSHHEIRGGLQADQAAFAGLTGARSVGAAFGVAGHPTRLLVDNIGSLPEILSIQQAACRFHIRTSNVFDELGSALLHAYGP